MATHSRKVVLIGWDAADWKVIRPLIAAGRMPNLQRLVDNGSHGQIATLHPPLSPMLWTSIATGKRPFQHGIYGFSEPTPDGSGIRPVTNLSRTCKALWNILNQNDFCSIVIGWWPSHPVEPIHGVMVSDHYHRAHGPLEQGWPILPNTVHPPGLAECLANLRVHPEALTPELVERFVPHAADIDQDKDNRLALLLRTLAECMSIQAAALWLIENQPWDFFAVYFDAIDHFSHGFMRYHPPRQSWIDESDFEMYRDVVSTAYQFHDEMLGALLDKAGADITVVLMSDHGFHPDHLRPSAIPNIPAGPAVEHRDLGILAMAGPDLKKNQVLYAPSVLDITPTILTMYGLPVGEDMDGKVLSDAFFEIPKVGFIPSWEAVPGDDGRHPQHSRADPVAAYEALEQMIALGYIERPAENPEIAVKKTVRELRYNLAEAYQDAGRHSEAREIFTELHVTDPSELRFSLRLFASCQALGLHEEMQQLIADLKDRTEPALVHFLTAQISIFEKKYPEALTALERVIETQSAPPSLLLQTGDLYLKLRRLTDAQAIYEKLLADDPDNAPAYLGLCRVALRQRKYDCAVDSALSAVERSYHDPQAHFLLGRALAGAKQCRRAADAFHAALSFNPHFPEAHRLLAVLLKRLGDENGAREHRRLASQMKNSRAIPDTLFDSHLDSSILPEPDRPVAASVSQMPPLSECLVIVTGLPRSGTSMLMQMLAAGGLSILSDNTREPDEDNPRGYFEFDPVKNLLRDSEWLCQARGKAVKIVAPLLAALPASLPCRVILCERNLEELLDSQDRMLSRRGQPAPSHARRQTLRAEYARILERTKYVLASRRNTEMLVVQHRSAIRSPQATAEAINEFLGGGFSAVGMAAAVNPALHRSRRYSDL